MTGPFDDQKVTAFFEFLTGFDQLLFKLLTGDNAIDDFARVSRLHHYG